MTSTDDNVTVWFIPINANHRPIYTRQFSVKLPKNATISELESKIEEYLARRRAPDSFSRIDVWRCTDPTKSFTDGDMDTLETEVKACFTDKQVRKPAVRLKIQDLHLLDGETLLVETTVARQVWYLTVDHEMRPIRKAAVTAIVRSIEDLAKSAKEGSPNHIGHVKHEALTVWRSTFLKLRNAPLNDLTSIIDEIDFDVDFKAVALFQGTLVTDLDLFHDEVLLVQVPERDEDGE